MNERTPETTIRFERLDDQSCMVYLGDERIGKIEKLDDRDWHAMDGKQRRSFYTRDDAVDWLRQKRLQPTGQNATYSALRGANQCNVAFPPVGRDKTANPLPDYFHLLVTASRASEAVDRFDLRSDDPNSVTAFRKLRSESLQATIALLDYSAMHNEAIKQWLSGSLSNE